MPVQSSARSHCRPRPAVLAAASLLFALPPVAHARMGTLDPSTAHLDPQVRKVLAERAAAPPADPQMTPQAQRIAQDSYFIARGLRAVDRVDVETRRIDGPAGPLRIRIYRPRGHLPHPRPIAVYFHGGGMSAGSLEQYDPLCQRLSQRSGAVIVAVDYRLAPENRFPAAMDDAYAGLLWTHRHAAELGADPKRLAVAGDSAGGNLAAVVAQRARDEAGPRLAFQLLIYPAVGFGGHSRSLQDFASGYFFGAEELEAAIDAYAAPGERTNPRVFPINAASLANLPPAYIVSAEYEVMRDDIEDYAGRLKRAGVPVELKRYRGMIHPFVSLAGVIDAGRLAIDEAADRLRRGLADPHR